jgi:hypothetical protein
MARFAVADLLLVTGAALSGGAGAGFLVFAAHDVLTKTIGPQASASLLGVLLVLTSAFAWLMLLRRYRTLNGDRSNAVQYPSGPPVDPGVFAMFLIGFVLARRILGSR